MSLPLQRVLLVSLVALVPVVAYAVFRSDLTAVVAALNVVLIWLTLRIATGGSPQPGNGTSSV